MRIGNIIEPGIFKKDGKLLKKKFFPPFFKPLSKLGSLKEGSSTFKQKKGKEITSSLADLKLVN